MNIARAIRDIRAMALRYAVCAMAMPALHVYAHYASPRHAYCLPPYYAPCRYVYDKRYAAHFDTLLSRFRASLLFITPRAAMLRCLRLRCHATPQEYGIAAPLLLALRCWRVATPCCHDADAICRCHATPDATPYTRRCVEFTPRCHVAALSLILPLRLCRYAAV